MQPFVMVLYVTLRKDSAVHTENGVKRIGHIDRFSPPVIFLIVKTARVESHTLICGIFLYGASVAVGTVSDNEFVAPGQSVAIVAFFLNNHLSTVMRPFT